MFQNTVTFVLTILSSLSLFIDIVPQLAYESTKFTSVTRNMIYHEFFFGRIFLRVHSLYLIQARRYSKRGVWAPYVRFISSRFTCLWRFQISVFHEYYCYQIHAGFQIYTFLFLRDVPFWFSVSRDIPVSFVRLSSLSPLAGVELKYPSAQLLISHCDVIVQMILSWPLKSTGHVRQLKFPT